MEQEFSDLVSQLYEKREYRPVGVAVLHTGNSDNRKFLVTQSAKSSEAWLFPQGGINLREKLEDNLSRELTEELGINFNSDITNVNSAYYFESLGAESTRKDKGGFTRGKAYIFTLCQYIGDGNFVLQEDEVADAKWMDYKEALKFFNLGRLEKANLSKRAIDRAISILNE